MINLMHKQGSKASRFILDNSKINKYIGGKPDVLINYGLSGNSLRKFYSKYPRAERIPTINRNVGKNKYNVVKIVEREGIKVPRTLLELPKGVSTSKFIEKRFHSIGGIGIRKATTRHELADKYYQEFIENRAFEIRVHMFLWSEKIVIQRRMGDKDKIAWNFRNGGRFSTVVNQDRKIYSKASLVTKDVLKSLKMGFGATDFIVDTDNNLYFLEVNSAPGFIEELTGRHYIDIFNQLVTTPTKKLLSIAI